MGVGGYSHATAVLPPGINRFPWYRRPSSVQRPVWTPTEILTPTGFRSFDHPACSKSLHRISQPGPLQKLTGRVAQNVHTEVVQGTCF